MTENLNWWKIVLDNWSQITVLLGIIGYIIKTIIDWRLTKHEISFTKIQELRILEIKDFYKSYQSLRISLQTFLDQTEYGEHSHDIFNKIRNEIREDFINFEFNCMTLKLFIEQSEKKTIDEISSVCESIRVDIERWHIYSKQKNHNENEDTLLDIRNIRLKSVLPDLIKKLENSLRKNYNLD